VSPPGGQRTAAAAQSRGTALLLGGGVFPTSLLAEVLRRGATIRPIEPPRAAPEPGYHPSVGLAEFVRMRDMYCRAPGCDVAADRCDVDHTIPWPLAPTHPSNLKCLCRKHHMLKARDPPAVTRSRSTLARRKSRFDRLVIRFLAPSWRR
jgi:hypothetical protein